MFRAFKDQRLHAVVGRVVLGLLAMGVVSAVMIGFDQASRNSSQDTVDVVSQTYRKVRSSLVA